MGIFRGAHIVRDGLILSLDPSSQRSYPGSGTLLKDLTGNDDFTIYNGTEYLTEKSGILKFDGIDDYARISSSDGVVSSGSDGLTVSMWINAQSWTYGSCPCTGAMSIMDWSTGYWNYFGILSSGSPYWVIYNQDPNGAGNPPAGVSLGFSTSSLNTWLNFGCTFSNDNPGTMKSYLNGVEVASAQLQSTFTVTAAIDIARHNRHCGYCYGNFKIGNFSIYNRPLDSSEMLQNFTAHKSKFGL